MNDRKKIILGSRQSPLARVQVEEFFALLKNQDIGFECEAKYFETQ